MGNPQLPADMLSEGQMFNRAFDRITDAFRVSLASGSVTLSGGISIGAVTIQDGSNPSNLLKVNADGSLDVNAVLGAPTDSVSIGNSSGSLINPAREETAGSILAALHDIRDTSGVKKITDPVTVLQGTSPWVVSGSLSVTFPAVQTVTGSVGISGPVIASITNFPATQTVTGSVGISGPVTVYQGTSPWVMTGGASSGTEYPDGTPIGLPTGSVAFWKVPDGTVRAVSNASPFPISDASGSITVDGTITALQGAAPWTMTGSVGISGPIVASITNFPAVQSVTGSVGITELPPVTQGTNPWTVTGSVGISGPVVASITNFPATQLITGSVGISGTPTVNQGTNPWIVSGSVTFNNPQIGVIQGTNPWIVTGSVGISGAVIASITNFPASQIVTGSVTINNPSFNAIQGTSPWVVSQQPGQSFRVVETGASGSTGGTPGAVNVTASAPQIIAANPLRKKLMIYNHSTTVTVFIGTSAVSIFDGMPLPPQSSYTDSMPFCGTEAIYGVVQTGSASVRYKEWV